jgi:hypothetical protein
MITGCRLYSQPPAAAHGRGTRREGRDTIRSGEQHRRPECLQAVGGPEGAMLTPAVSPTIAHAEAIGTRRGSRPAIAAHGVNHPAYWREKTGEHASTAQSDERRDADRVVYRRLGRTDPRGGAAGSLRAGTHRGDLDRRPSAATTFEPIERAKVMNRAPILCADSRLDTRIFSDSLAGIAWCFLAQSSSTNRGVLSS